MSWENPALTLTARVTLTGNTVRVGTWRNYIEHMCPWAQGTCPEPLETVTTRSGGTTQDSQSSKPQPSGIITDTKEPGVPRIRQASVLPPLTLPPPHAQPRERWKRQSEESYGSAETNDCSGRWATPDFWIKEMSGVGVQPAPGRTGSVLTC